jgi:hypothetical protein
LDFQIFRATQRLATASKNSERIEMAFTLTPAVQVERDANAAVCAYYHVEELFRLIVSFGYNPITN